MDSIIIKIIDSFKIPGIIVAIVYFACQQKFISIIQASDIEKIFFTHEKKQVYKVYNWMALYLITLVVELVMSFTIWYLLQKYDLISFFALSVISNLFFIVITCVSIILFFTKKRRKIKSFIETINKNEKNLTVILVIYYVFIILSVAGLIASGANSVTNSDKEFVILLNTVLITLFLPTYMRSLFSPWIYKGVTIFSFVENEDTWYVLKLIRENEFLVGDSFIEEKCKKLKFICYEELRKKIILINKINEN